MLTTALEAEVNARKAQGWWVDVDSADATVRTEFLARHFYVLLRRVLEAVPGDDDKQATAQVALVNQLVDALVQSGAIAADRIADAAQLLLEAGKRSALGDTPSPLTRPTLSLRRTGLLVNGRRDVQIASESVEGGGGGEGGLSRHSEGYSVVSAETEIRRASASEYIRFAISTRPAFLILSNVFKNGSFRTVPPGPCIGPDFVHSLSIHNHCSTKSSVKSSGTTGLRIL